MSAKKDGGHAFPTFYADPNVGSGYPGMTLRDYFAAAALTAMCTRTGAWNAKEIAVNAYHYADAMLAERAERKGL